MESRQTSGLRLCGQGNKKRQHYDNAALPELFLYMLRLEWKHAIRWLRP